MQVPGYDVGRRIAGHGPYVVHRGVRQRDREPVLLKIPVRQPAVRSDLDGLEREQALAAELPVTGIPRVLELIRGPDAACLVLEDDGLVSFGTLGDGGRLELPAFHTVSLQLATIVSELHRRRVVHGAINPDSVLVREDGSLAQLLHAGTAGPPGAAGVAAPGEVSAYMSPEQTGRINRSVDYRTDFYSLGALLFTMLTGRPPFAGDDPLELVHAHIARTPPSPTHANPDVPEQLSRVVLKLLAKAPAERYQSALGLVRDLERCRREWTARGTITLFEPGQQDMADRLITPPGLYGRDRHVAELRRAFEETCRGESGLLLVAGYSGIGKTSLIQELQRPILRQRGYFVSGKADQIVRNIPYGVLAQALGSLVRQLLTESEERLAGWRVTLAEALGANAAVLAEVIPEIELVTGRQPPPPPLEPTEAGNRFSYVFQSFVGRLAQQDHPLVIFLDDLQWVDAATLNLLHDLLTSAGLHHLLIIGAFRDNEVDAAHPLTAALSRLQAAGAPVRRVSLETLPLPDLTRFLCDTLHGRPDALEPLARLIDRKTGGNPFFVIQFLKTLEREGLLTRDAGHPRWTFDMDAIAAAGMTDNVVDLMARKIRRLSPGAQNTLMFASCIGSAFEWETLATVSRQDAGDVTDGLAEALREGLIERGDDRPTRYAFLHDRVQQAAYDLIPAARKKPVHMEVGRLLLADVDPETPDDRLFAILNHLNIGWDLVSDRTEARSIARLNLAAGRRARGAAAYRAAADYLRYGMALLGEDGWRTDHDLLWPLHLEATECDYLAGSFERAQQAFPSLLTRARTPLERAQVHSLRMTLFENQSRWLDALSAGQDGLALFGISFPGEAPAKEEALERELSLVQAGLGDKPIASLIDLPVMPDDDMRMVFRLLTIAWAPAYIAGDATLARLISATMVRLSLLHGNAEESAYGYVTHAITIGPVRGDYPSAYEWGTLALAVNRRFEDVKRRAKIHQQFQAHVNLWCRPFETCIPHAREAARSGLQAGDFTYAGYGAATEAWPALLVSRDLDAFIRDYSPTLALLEKIRMTDFLAAHHVILNWARALQGRTASRLSLSTPAFDEQAFIARYEGTAPFFLTFVFAARLHLCLLLGDYTLALAAAARARKAAVGGTIWPVLIDAWGGLAAAGAFDRAAVDDRPALRRQVVEARDRLHTLAGVCPPNFKGFWLLLSAEAQRIDARPGSADRLCEEAVRYARETGNLQHEALASEMRGRVLLLRREDAAARACFEEAYRCYEQWGASSKLDDLAARARPLQAPSHPSPAVPTAVADAVAAPADHAREPASLDMSTGLKVAHALAMEVEMGGLLRKLMQLALENAGAQRGVFLEERGNVLLIRARARADGEPEALTAAQPLDEAADLAVAVVRYAHRTRHDVVVGDAAADERFAGDAYILRSAVKSILCVPVSHQGRPGGILYLENNLTTEAFSPARIQMMRILAAQTAISLENARLYEEMKGEIARRSAAETALRTALTDVEALTRRLEAENVYLQEEIRLQHNFNEIVGNGPALLEALRKVERVAPTETSVLIVGETGSGKELFARAVHSRSRRSGRPLVKVNCGAIAPGLVESELFGHAKGAFTGAIEKRIGRFELADGGTIFLDEIGELPVEAQVKLLRVLQEQEFEPVGSNRTVRVSVRVIAATNRNLEEAVREGRFRPDLLYRLNVFPIEVPPLRDRPSDIPLLVAFFSTALARRLGKPIHGVSARSMQWMTTYAWPGNVRELQNVVERAGILAQTPILETDGDTSQGAAPGRAAVPRGGSPGATTAPADSLDAVQRSHILSVLQSTQGVVEGARGAASILGLHPNTLRSRMKKLGISRPGH